MTVRRGHVSIAMAAAALALPACGSVPAAGRQGQAGGASLATRPAHAAPARGVAGSCGPPPPRHAWAAEVTTAGRTLWMTPLPTRNVFVSPAVQPVPAGQAAVFAQDGIVHGASLADGHPLWSWTGGQTVYGMWRWQHLVVVLTDQVSDHSRLTGLDAATGTVRWSLRLPAQGLLGGQAATADGGLAMVTTGGVLQVVSLADGAVRWQRATVASPALTAAGHLVIFGGNGRLTGYDDVTGRPIWTASGLPQDQIVQMAGGLALVTSNAQGPGQPTALTAVVPATGRIAWRFDPGQPVTVLSAGSAGLAVMVYFDRRLYLLDPRTGRPRWQANTFVVQGTVPLVTRTAVIAAEGLQRVRLVARDATDGRVVWQDALAQPPLGDQLVAQAGAGNPLAVLQEEPGRPHEPALLLAFHLTSGRLAWRASLPAFVPAVPMPVTGGFLVQPADSVYACALAG